jgi:hypothetical protein
VNLGRQERCEKADLLFDGKPGIMAATYRLVPVRATLAQSAEQTLRKRQVKGSNPLGGLVNVDRPQPEGVGAFAISQAFYPRHGRHHNG